MAEGETDSVVALLEGQVKALYLLVDERNATIDALRHELTLKDFEITRLKRMLFGQRRERFDTKTAWLPGLLPTAQNDAPAAQPPAPEKPAKERKPRKTARPRLDTDPAKVPERHVTQKPAQTRCDCCGGALVQIGEERHERIECKPQVLERVITHRPRMACNRCKGGGVVVAPKDDPPITGAGPVGLSLAVDISVQHYADHLPFHRIATRYARDGLFIDRATLSRVAGRAADALQLVVGAMEAELLSSDAVMGIDGTGIKILAPGRCRRRAAYVLHGRGHVVYRMLQAEDANTVLEGFGAFRGVVISDAAKVHTGKVGAAMGLDVALCNAHARRHFFDARETDPAHAEYALSFYATVAQCEQQWSTLDPAARQAARQRELVPRFEAFRGWLQDSLGKVSARSPMAGALGYALRHHEGLTRFLSDGRVPWTNNESERLLRHVVVGRKAWVFRGTFEGAVRGCVLWSLMMSCRLHGIDPRQYLIDTLNALATTPKRLVGALTPAQYAARAQAAAARAA